MTLENWLGESTEHPGFDYAHPVRLSHWLDNRLHYAGIHSALPTLVAYQPTTSGDMIEFWENKIKRDRGIRITIKPGKAITRMFPNLDSSHLARMVDRYRDEFVPFKITIHRSQSASAFKHAYAHDPAKQRDVDTDGDRKSMSASCMRYEFDDLPHHPAEVYASGDFEIIWAETEDGKIAGRCVVCTKLGRGPIYGVSEEVLNELDEYVDTPLANSWHGARLLRIDIHGGNKVMAPYLDIRPRYGSLGRTYLTLGKDYGVELDTPCGYRYI